MGRSARNIGGPDRAARVGLGLALLVLCVAGQLGWWGLLGIYPLATGLLGRDPLYRWFGLDSANYPHYRL